LGGGGQLNDSGSHLLAVLLFSTGLSVKRCSAFIDNLGCRVDINSALSVEFDGGAQGNLSVVGNGPGWYEDITIWCEKGAFYMRNGKLEVSDAVGKRRIPTAEEMPKGGNPDDNFIDAILGKAEVGCPAIWGLRVIEWTEAAWNSAKTGETVRVERA
jgi:predicted dehydrogenase